MTDISNGFHGNNCFKHCILSTEIIRHFHTAIMMIGRKEERQHDPTLLDLMSFPIVVGSFIYRLLIT